MPLADDYQRIIDSLPPDWSYLQFDLRINEEDRYVELAPIVAEVNAWPLSKADYHWRFNVAREVGHAAAAVSVHRHLAKLGRLGGPSRHGVREGGSGGGGDRAARGGPEAGGA